MPVKRLFSAAWPGGQYERKKKHLFGCVDPIRQKLPSGHKIDSLGVGQYVPAGHGFSIPEPAGQ